MTISEALAQIDGACADARGRLSLSARSCVFFVAIRWGQGWRQARVVARRRRAETLEDMIVRVVEQAEADLASGPKRKRVRRERQEQESVGIELARAIHHARLGRTTGRPS